MIDMRRGTDTWWLVLGLAACTPAPPPPCPPTPAPVVVAAPPPEPEPAGQRGLDVMDDAAGDGPEAPVDPDAEPAARCDWVVEPGRFIRPTAGEAPPQKTVREGVICLWGHPIPRSLDDRPEVFDEKGCKVSSSPDGTKSVDCPGVKWLFSGPASAFEGIHIVPLDD